MARRRHGDAAGRQCPRRRNLDSLARHPAARQHGRCAGAQLRRHPRRPELHLSLPGQAERHLLVPQPLGIPGAAGCLRSARHRAARAGTVRVRPRARVVADRLDRRESRARLRQAEEAVGLLQLPAAHRRRLLPGRRAQRPWGHAERTARVGRNAHERRRSGRRHRLHLHLPDERPATGRQLDGTVHAGRAGSAAGDQRLGHVCTSISASRD